MAGLVKTQQFLAVDRPTKSKNLLPALGQYEHSDRFETMKKIYWDQEENSKITDQLKKTRQIL